MVHNAKIRFLINAACFIAACGLFVIIWGTKADVLAQRQAKTAKAHKEAVASQPLYSAYKGVRIGMTADEVRAKLGEPAQKADDQDFYVISEKETVQICYNALHRVVAISVDYLGGSGSPDYKEVIGQEVETKPDGSVYKLVRYEKAGFWVSYNRSASNSMVTITIQQIK